MPVPQLRSALLMMKSPAGILTLVVMLLATDDLTGTARGQEFPYPDIPWLSGEGFSTQALACGDIDGDGGLNLVCGNYTQSSTWYLNAGGALAYSPVICTDCARDP